MTTPHQQYVDWLVEQSMLNAARQRAKTYSRQGRLWQRPFALARTRDKSAIASLCFTAYPATNVTPEADSVLAAQ
ncbi:maltose alpha-D-glucosyltransferase, partial [Pseudomonas syringae pv. tagetis]